MGVMSENLVSISDFASSRQQDRGTVAAWIRKHPEVDEGCTMVGKDKCIDINSAAYRMLDKQYPLPLPVEVVVDHESRDKLLEAQDKLLQAQELITELYKQIGEKDKLIAQNESAQLLLEDRTKQLETEQEAHKKDLERAEAQAKEDKYRYDEQWLRANEAEEKLKEMEDKAAENEKRLAQLEEKFTEEKQRAKSAENELYMIKSQGFFSRLFKKGWLK